MKLFFLSLIMLSSVSCVYLENRRKDLTDAVNFNFAEEADGAVIFAGPASLGWLQTGDFAKPSLKYHLGLGGLVTEKEEGIHTGFVQPFTRAEGFTRSLTSYKETAPAIFAVGLDLGISSGIGLKVDVLETLDFILGIFMIDILLDDRGFKKNHWLSDTP